MEVLIDLDDITVRLLDPEVFDAFSVRAVGAASMTPHDREHRLGDVLVATHTGRLHHDGPAFIDRTALAFLAAGGVSEKWAEQFAQMCTKAQANGWIGDDGAIQAHVVFSPPLV